MQTILDMLNTAARELTDEGPVKRWTQVDLLKFYNSAVSAIANYRPDIFATTQTVTCVTGAKQALPTGARRLIEVERITGGRVLRVIQRNVLDEADPDWMTGTTTNTPEAYCYDESNPSVFWLYPPVTLGLKVDIVASVTPPIVAIEQINTALPFDQTYQTPCLDWILYRAYMRDSEDTVNANRAQLHLQSFAQFLGIKLESDRSLSQRRLEKSQANKG